jgi:hypothetical protein
VVYVPWLDVFLMVVGRLLMSTVEIKERMTRGPENDLIDTSQFSSMNLFLISIQLRSLSRGALERTALTFLVSEIKDSNCWSQSEYASSTDNQKSNPSPHRRFIRQLETQPPTCVAVRTAAAVWWLA